ncbi:MAG: hypothetical protein KAS49_00755 [Candidatus Cloacimonetes bacterium]|nr:hypothetical protein [Candidatus Cloacimonadota bacterium]
MKTYIMEPMPELFWQQIRERNLTEYFTEVDDPNVEIIIIRTKVQFDKALFEKYSKLKMIIRAGSGFDNIDVKEAGNRDVAVCNTPEANAFSAYEHTIAMILALIKNLQTGKKEILANNWKSLHPDNWEIADLRVLVVGLGRVGTRVANVLKYLGAEVRAVDPYLSKKEWEERAISPIHYIEGLKWCNMITYHCPLFEETYHYFNHAVLTEIENPIWLANVARGGIVDYEAVKKGLGNGQLLGVGMDVFEQEPWCADSLAADSRIYITPHTGAFTKAAKNRMSIETIDVWNRFVFDDLILTPVDGKFI